MVLGLAIVVLPTQSATAHADPGPVHPAVTEYYAGDSLRLRNGSVLTLKVTRVIPDVHPAYYAAHRLARLGEVPSPQKLAYDKFEICFWLQRPIRVENVTINVGGECGVVTVKKYEFSTVRTEPGAKYPLMDRMVIKGRTAKGQDLSPLGFSLVATSDFLPLFGPIGFTGTTKGWVRLPRWTAPDKRGIRRMVLGRRSAIVGEDSSSVRRNYQIW